MYCNKLFYLTVLQKILCLVFKVKRRPASVAAAYPATAPLLVVQRLHCHLLE